MIQNATKGEWYAKDIHVMSEGVMGRIGQSFIMNLPRPENNFAKDTEALTNARLFAASKDMYEAIQPFARLAEQCKGFDKEPDSRYVDCDWELYRS
jgi:hypothetical protein